jgi:hypothetical protein
MSARIAKAHIPVEPWQRVAHEILSGDPLDVLDRLADAAGFAEQTDDYTSHSALCANALSFMLLDWRQFVGWREWIDRFERSVALSPSSPEDSAQLIMTRCTGELACALLRGDGNTVLEPLGQRLERLTEQPFGADQTLLAACSLLPWLQMSRNPAAAQTVHHRVLAFAALEPESPPGQYYLRGVWLAKWAQHVHFYEPTRFPEVLEQLDAFLVHAPGSSLLFLRAKLDAENCMAQQDTDRSERSLAALLVTIRPQRPMERVIYNNMVTVLACTLNDPDRARQHAAHMMRELIVADCPPSLAASYRTVESRVSLLAHDYENAATILDAQAQHMLSAHVAVFRGFAELARALHAHRQGEASRDALREHLHRGLSAMRAVPNDKFFLAVPEARAAVCALAMREGIETAFVIAALKAAPVVPPAWADEHWPWALTLRCFAGFRAIGLTDEERGASKASSRPLNLLKFIAAHGTRGVTVAQAADALWPAQDGDQAENSLSVTLLRLRRMHVEGELIERRDGWLQLNAERVWTDVAALEAHLDAMPDGNITEASRIEYAKRLFDLYRGDCLFGLDDEWANSRTAHYRERVTAAARRLLVAAHADQHTSASALLSSGAKERDIELSV